MATVIGKTFLPVSVQTPASYGHRVSKNSGQTTQNVDWTTRGHGGKPKFKLPSGVTMPVLSNRNAGRSGGFCDLEIIKSKRDTGQYETPPIQHPDRGFKLLKCSSRVQDSSREVKQGLLSRIGPYHWQTSQQRASVPHDARDIFYRNNIHKEDSNIRFRETRLPNIPKRRPWTVVVEHTRHKDKFHSQPRLIPRKRRTMVMQFHNTDQKTMDERGSSGFQVRRMKTEIGRFSTPEAEEEYTPPRPWVIRHGERPLKCEFTRPRYGHRRNTPNTYLICIPRANINREHKSVDSYMRYVEARKSDTFSSGQNESKKGKCSSEQSNSSQSKLKTPSVNGEKSIKTSKSAKTSISKSKTENIVDKSPNTGSDKCSTGSVKCPNENKRSSTVTSVKHTVPSGDADINCIGIKPDGVLPPAYGYDTLVLQSVIDVNQPGASVTPVTSNKTDG